jgi:hypothetical protein
LRKEEELLEVSNQMNNKSIKIKNKTFFFDSIEIHKKQIDKNFHYRSIQSRVAAELSNFLFFREMITRTN